MIARRNIVIGIVIGLIIILGYLCLDSTSCENFTSGEASHEEDVKAKLMQDQITQLNKIGTEVGSMMSRFRDSKISFMGTVTEDFNYKLPTEF